MKKNSNKKTWTRPELTVHGTVEEITQKDVGFGDAMVMTDETGGSFEGRTSQGS